MAGLVFISYCSQDDPKYCNELLVALEAVPALRERVWLDRKGIRVGDQFHPEIQRALADTKVAILLVSSSFFNSHYITNHELPFLLREAKSQTLKLGILYVTAVADDALSIDIEIDSQTCHVQLTDTESFNTPGEPLDRIDARGDRNVLYVEAANWASREFKPAAAPSRTSPEASGKRCELAIFIEARRERWQHQFFWPNRPDSSKPDMHCPQPAMLVDDDVDGEMLYQLLFGSDQIKAGQLLQESFDTRRPADPTYAPLRVRLVTGDPRLQRLPWSDIAYQGRPLRQVGWTVELHAPAGPGFPEFPQHLCYFPGRVVLAASTASRRSAHFVDLHRFFQRHWPENPVQDEPAADANALRDALGSGSTRLVYYYGPASARGLLVDDREDGACVSWADLADWLKRSQSVSLVFLNVVGATLPAVLANASALLDGVKGAVLVQGNADDRGHAAAIAGLAWLDAVLCRRIDPVVALHQQAYGQIGACTRYSNWETKAPARLRNVDLVTLLLDRHRQRDNLLGARNDFYTFPERTIHHVVALGTPGCRTSDFPSMIKQHLVANPRGSGEVYLHQSIALPPATSTVHDVDDQVRRRLKLGPRQPLLDGLLDPEALAGTAYCFLVLGWQVQKPPYDATSLLRAVADWCCQRLDAELGSSGRQPAGRVLSIVAVESERTDELADQVEALIDDYDSQKRFNFAKLDRLAAVDRADLRRYFRNETICSCDDRYRETFPDRLLGGRKEMPFDQAVAAIRRGDPDHWGTLDDELTDMTSAGAWPPAHYEANFWSKWDAR